MAGRGISAPKFLKNPSINQADDGSYVIIECTVSANPKPKVSWSLNDKPLESNDHLSIALTGKESEYQCSLKISDVSVNDGGKYGIVIKNSAGELKSTVNLKFQVEEEHEASGKAKGTPPKFIGKPSIRQADDGNKVIFECTFSADPKPSFSWFKDNKSLENKGRYNMSLEQLPDGTFKAICVVSDVRNEDGGSYRVVLKNDSGESTASMNLNFAEEEPGRPIISPDIDIRPFVDKLDEEIIIQCTCTADPMPEFLWYFADKPLPETPKYEKSIVSDGNKYICILKIGKIAKNDSGTYRLVARNSKGEHAANIQLDISASHSLPTGIPPMIHKAPSYVQKGKDLIISVEFISDPMPALSWVKDGRKIQDYKVEKVENNIYRSSLTIKNAGNKDAGSYLCSAVNELGRSNATINIAFARNNFTQTNLNMTAPSLIGQPKLTYDADKRILKCDCRIKAKPEMKIDWKKGNLDIKDPKKYRSTLFKDRDDEYVASLEIMDFKPADADFYKLIASNEAGQFTMNLHLLSDSAEKVKMEEIIEIKLKNPRIIKDEKNSKIRVEVACESPEEPTVSWFKDDKTLKDGGRIHLNVTGKDKYTLSLDIDDCNKDDAGNYLISAKIGNAESTLPIILTEKDVVLPQMEPAEKKGIKPKFLGKLNNISSLDGDRIILQCKIEGDPKPQATWFCNGNEIPPSADFAQENDSKTVKLTIGDAYVEDTGTYTCKIKNELGEDSSSCQVTIRERRGRMKRIRKKVQKKPVPKPEEKETISPQEAKESGAETPRKPSTVGIEPAVVKPIEEPSEERASTRAEEAKATPDTKKPVTKAEAKIPGRKLPAADEPEPAQKEQLETTKPSEKIPERKPSVRVAEPIAVQGEKSPATKPREAPEKTPSTRVEEPKVARDVKPPTTKLADEVKPTTTPEDVESVPDMKKPVKLPATADIKKDTKAAAATPSEAPEVPDTGKPQAVGKRPALKAVKPVPKKDISAVATSLGDEPSPKWPTLRKTTVAKKVPDHWTTHLTDQKVKEEDGVAELSATFCKAGGSLRWYKNRVEIFHGHKYNFISEGPVQTLQINDLIPDDSGRYICSVNGVETKAWLEVTPASPEFEFYKVLPAKHEVFRTKPTILECHVNSIDCPVKWYKGNTLIKDEDKHFKIFRDLVKCMLRIPRTNRDDEDTYSCEIDDGTGKKTTCYLYVLEPQWRFSKKLPANTEVDEFHDFELTVEVEDPDAECEWFCNGEQILPDAEPDKYDFVSDGHVRKLIIKKADPTKDTCTIECKTGVMTTQTAIKVKPALKIVKGLKDLEGVENSEVTFSVTLNMPKKNVYWLKDGKRLLPSPNCVILSDGNTYTMTLKDLSLTDAGNYSMKIETLEDKCSLKVKEADKPPSIDMRRFPKSITTSVGKPVNIEIYYSANPPPEVIWTKDGKPIDNPNVEIVSDSKKSTLTIPETVTDDTGNYMITLKNSCGETSGNISVKVSDKPSAPEGPLRISEITKNSCVLGWRPPPSDGGSPITKYVVEKLDTSRGDWITVGEFPPTSIKCKVDKLTEGKTYEFRVRSVNAVGPSEPLQSSNPIIAKNPYEKPSSPDAPEVVDIDKNSVVLNWQKPASDGGAPIEKYVIEKKEGDTDWAKALEVDGNTLKVTVPNLKEESDYEFRISAVNKGGKSEPSSGSIPVRTTPKFVKPSIVTAGLKSVTVRKGQTITLEAPYFAKPEPSVVWKYGDETLTENARTKFTKTNKVCTLVIKDAVREDGGNYSIEISNQVGSDKVTVAVVVLGPPSRPSGPLKVSKVTKESVTLSWNPPTDDGGNRIQQYSIEKRDRETGEWKPVADSVKDTFFTVPKLKEGHEYDFRVMAANEIGSSEPLMTDSPVKVKNPFVEPDAPQPPEIVSRDRSHIKLQWKPPLRDGGAPIIGYIVERRDAKTEKWTKVHPEEMLMTPKFVDTKVAPDNFYEYRVSAVNEAGPSAPSKPTAPVPAKPEKEKPFIDQSKLPKVDGKNVLKVRAGQPVNIDLDILGVPKPEVKWDKGGIPLQSTDNLKMESNDDHIQLTIPVSKRSDTGNYDVKLRNDSGEDETTVEVVVLDVPGACVGPLNVDETTKDTIKLSWKPPDDDGGSPIVGYVVEKCPEDSVEWTICPEPVFQPKATIKNLEPMKKYKFRVRAENKYGVGEPLETAKEVLIKPPYDAPGAPNQPEITDFDVDHISIAWEKPYNDGGNPIQGYIVEKRTKYADWEPCNVTPIKGTSFTASDLRPNQAYEFRVTAVNDAGPGEPSRPSKTQKSESPITAPGAPGKPKIEDITKHSVTLTWKNPENDGGAKISKYIVEKRSSGDADWTEVAELPNKVRTYTVENLKEGDEISFRVKAVNKVGAGEPSDSSDLVLVEDQPAPPSFLDLSKIKDIVVHAGDSFDVFAPYKAVPKPFVEFSINETNIGNDDRIKCEVLDDGMVSLINNSAKREDAGDYKITLRNAEGTASAIFHVTVLDAPCKPEGPLTASNVDSDRCTLSWNPPKDDGGAPVASYIVEKRVAGTDRWTKAGPPTIAPLCVIKGLQDGVAYEFRVKAENAHGIGEPLVTDSPVKIKCPFNSPSAPGIPQCTGHTEESISLSWPKPYSDGGTPIIGYLIEKKEKAAPNWTPVNKKPIEDNKITVNKLKNGEQYEFRVSAINRAGQSPWTETDAAITARPEDLAPTVEFDAAANVIKVKAGEPLNITVPFHASPLPEASFSKGGIQIPDSENSAISMTDDKAELKIPCAKASDAGTYNCTLKNEIGQCQTPIVVEVIDVPASPEGPLTVSNVTPYSCSLEWNVPKTSGGSPITNYVIEKFDTREGAWKPVSRFCREPKYEVYGLDEDHEYKFRVFAENEVGKSEPLECEKTIVAKNPISKPDAPADLTVSESVPEAVTLEWEKPKRDGGSKISGYMLEVKDADTDDWSPVTTDLIRDTSFTVDFLLPEKPYDFRVKAKNAAGYSEPTRLARPVTVKRGYTVPGSPLAPEALSVGNDFVELVWEPPPADEANPITGYILEKKLPDSPVWEDALPSPVIDSSAVVYGLPPNSDVEFRVKAVNRVGESEPSASSGKIKITAFPDGKKPNFTKVLFDTTAKPYAPVNFDVEFTGEPVPDVKWFRNGNEINSGPKYNISATNKSSKLTILEAWDSDNDANIQCEIINPLGKDQCSCRLKLKKPPQVDKYDNEIFAKCNQNIRFKLPVKGERPMQCKLTKIGEDMPDENRIDIDDVDGEFVITLKNADVPDSGNYNVVLTNDIGSSVVPLALHVSGPPGKPGGPIEATNITMDSCDLSWRPPTSDGGSRITHYIIEKHDVAKPSDHWIEVTGNCKETKTHVPRLINGHEYEFRVVAVNAEGESEPLYTTSTVIAQLPFGPPKAPSAPSVTDVGETKVTLAWPKAKFEPVAPVTGYYIEKKEKDSDVWVRVNPGSPIHTNSGEVPYLLNNHEYQFRIVAENEAGLSAPSSPTDYVNVVDPNAVYPPEFVRKLADAIVDEDHSAKFEAEVKGSPAPDVVWMKGTTELHSGPDYVISREGNVCRLVVNHARPEEDSETITIKARNTGGSKTCRAQINVRAKPRIKVPQLYRSPQVYDENDSVVLKFPYTANPTPTAQWFLNGSELKPDEDENVSMELTDRTATLRLKNANRGYTGKYTLSLTNPLGTAEASVPVTISGPPGPPLYLTAENIMDDSIILSWQPPSDDGGTGIADYHIEMFQPKENKWVPVGACRSTRFIVPYLLPKTPYTFRVIAENRNGKSPPSLPLEGVVTEDTDAMLKRKAPYGIDAEGRRVRGREDMKPENYDKCFHNVWKDGTPPVASTKLGNIYDDYDIFEELGRGPFGVMHRAVEKATGKNYAIKFVDTPTHAHKQTLRDEIDVLTDLNHPNIVHLHDVYEQPDETALVYEFLSGPSLMDKLANPAYKLTEAEAIKYVKQVCEGLKKLHDNQIVHLDLKPESIVCETKDSDTIKLTDFSLARKVSPNEKVQVSLASVNFAAPEIVDHDTVGFSTDMWAVGALSYAILSGLPPFAGADDDETAEAIRRCDLRFPPKEFDSVSDAGKDFISNLLKKDKSKRMTVYEALDHPWLKEDHSDLREPLRPDNYDKIREPLRRKYGAYPEPVVGMGRMPCFSSLAKLRPRDYLLYDTYFDRREFIPRITIRKYDNYVIEGDNGELECAVIASTSPTISWYRANTEIRQSTKYLKKSNDPLYSLEIKKCTMDDDGEYVVKASNSYGEKTATLRLFVKRVKEAVPPTVIEPKPMIHVEYPLIEIWQQPNCAPLFTYILRTRVIQSGLPVKFSCTVTGIPTPKITWFKNHIDISDDPKYTINYVHGVCTLVIYSVSVNDIATYRCVAENSVGRAETSCQLFVQGFYSRKAISESREVYTSNEEFETRSRSSHRERRDIQTEKKKRREIAMPPEIKEELSSITVYEGSILLLQCRLVGKPVPEIVWKKDGDVLRASNRIEQTFENGLASLKIQSVKPFDAGEFEVIATNEHGKASSLAQVIVKESTMPATADESEETLKEPEEVSVETEVSAADETAGTEKKSDAEETAEAETDQKEETKVTAATETRPLFSKHLSGINLKDGDKLFLECELAAYFPDYSVTWMRNGKAIPNTAEFKQSRNDNVFSLEVGEIFPEDSGVFSLSVTSPAGNSESACSVIVHDADESEELPYVEIFPNSLNAHVGQAVEFKTKAHSKAPITARWLQNDKRIVESRNVSLTTKENEFILKIVKVAAEHDGTYFLTLSTNEGEAIIAFSLQVDA